MPKLDVPPEAIKVLKKQLRSGDICYQFFTHVCGYRGNSFKKDEQGRWQWLTHCPACDLLLIGGDICIGGKEEKQAHWLDTSFRAWLKEVPARKVIGVWGNHDF